MHVPGVCRKKQRVNGLLEYDVDNVDAEGLRRYRTIFYDQYDGFSLACLETSPTAAAESMLRNSWLGVQFGPQVGPSPQGPPAGFPSDWTDIVYYSQNAVGCAVEGFAPSADAIAGLDIPDGLKRAMQLARSSELSWLSGVGGPARSGSSPAGPCTGGRGVVDPIGESTCVGRAAPLRGRARCRESRRG